ncbi:hypothetical protein ACFU99_17795 [Streptomyces sp. NPDC057654]|uniref:hypothetical protein n=1 Tax=Streptomyces sp. NPDC057654 TaxID=3346196 RepID=UPI0036BC9D20
MSPHPAGAWTRVLTAAADTATLQAARHLLTAHDAPLNINQGFATSKFPLLHGRVARPRLHITPLPDQQWDRIEAALLSNPGQLTDPAGTPLTPAPHEITHTCPCTPGTTTPCAHSTALALLLTERLHTAPDLLCTLRGRPYPQLKKRLRTQETTPAPETADPPPAPPTPTGTAPPIPEPADLDLTNARPALTGAPPPPAPLPDLPALTALAADAAHRAAALLHGHDTPPSPDTDSDLARFTALKHGIPYRQAAMDHLGLGTVAMGHLTLAHTHGGPAGAAAYLHPHAVDHEILARAQADIQPLRPAPHATVECEDNRLTDPAAGIQLRYGPDGRWYPYRAPYGTWHPVPGPSTDPAQAYRAARKAARPR